jgi:lysophospholipase L1-like esterase
VLRGHALIAAVAVAASFLGLGTAAALGAIRPPSAAPHPVAASQVVLRMVEPASGSQRSGVSACEQAPERAHPHDLPRMLVVGASFTAGVGSGPSRSWAVLLARHLHWDAVVYGVPGAGYVRAGAGRKGPVAAEVARIGLAALKPSLIIVQAGHDDIGVRTRLEQQRVEQAITLIRAAAPRARIALLTVFTGRSSPAAASRTDQAIVRAARAVDPAVIIVDPLTGGWRFPHVRDGLHPTAAGSAWIAGQVATILRAHGVHPAPAHSGAIICDWA